MTTTYDARAFGVRLLLEGLVVVASILVAFGLDAWWNGHEVEQDVRQELQSVRRELEENRRLVLFEINSLERILTATDSVLLRMEAEQARPELTVPDTLAMLVTYWGPTLDASLGAVDALIASGRLSRIDDAELRQGLAGLKDRFEDPVEDELLAQRVQIEQLIPMLSRHVDFGPIARVDTEFFIAERTLGTALPSYGTAQLPNDREIRNVLRARATWLGSALGEMGPLLRDIDRLIALIPAPAAR